MDEEAWEVFKEKKLENLTNHRRDEDYNNQNKK